VAAEQRRDGERPSPLLALDQPLVEAAANTPATATTAAVHNVERCRHQILHAPRSRVL